MVRAPNRRPHRPAHRSQQNSEAVAEARLAPTESETPAAEGSGETRKPVQPFTIEWVQPVGKRRLNMMIYGPFGHGKTHFAGTALDVPSMQDVIFIAAEPGDMSLTSRRTLDIVKVNKYDNVARVFDYLTLHCYWRDQNNIEKMLEAERSLKSTIVPLDEQTVTDDYPLDSERTWFVEQRIRSGKPMDEPYLYRTVIIDSLSEVHKYLVYKFTGVEIGKTKLTVELERMEEWQVAQEMFRLFIRSFRDLPMNVIFVSAESIEPEMRNKKKNPLAGAALPKLAGQAAADVAGFVDIVGYLVRETGREGEEDHRYLYLGAGYEGWISKHRFDNLPDLDFVENPTMTSILDLARKDAEKDGTRITSSADSDEGQLPPVGTLAGPTHRRSPARSTGADSGSRSGRGRRADTIRRRR